MKITVNGDEIEMADSATAADLILQLKLEGKRVAMEVNREIVPRSTYADHPLQQGDNIELVHAIGGG
ncbi:MAG: sulfur carrier protein ThiS [Gammaproteobacteria bacterium]|nr:sulfur carrier protein ThiS [Gammaproteobacteria bacterium]